MSSRRGFRALAALVLLPVVLAGTAMANVVAAGQTQGTVFIQTAPALGGVHLLVGSTTVTTGPDGSAMVTVADINRIAARVSLARSVLDSRTTLPGVRQAGPPHRQVPESPDHRARRDLEGHPADQRRDHGGRPEPGPRCPPALRHRADDAGRPAANADGQPAVPQDKACRRGGHSAGGHLVRRQPARRPWCLHHHLEG